MVWAMNTTGGMDTTRDTNPAVEANLDLAHKMAKHASKRFPRHIEYGDLLGYAMVGLLDAADKYDPAAGTTFKSYAQTRMAGEIASGVRDHLSDKYRQRRRLGIEEPVSLFVRCDGGNDFMVRPDAGPSTSPDPLHEVRDRDEWDRMLATVPMEGREEAALYYRDGLNMREIAERRGCSESWVCLCLKRHRNHLADELRRRGVVRDGESVIPHVVPRQRPRKVVA